MAEKTYLQAISDGLREEMRRDKRVFLIGEDVGVYGGAFKVSLGFQEEFGPWRVIDAPLSETAIVAGCTGAAIMGMRPVAEMQFADFISCAWDHLVTVAAKQRWRAGTPVPITVRLPSGGGFSGGPFHSQNPESSFAHIPGLKCVCPATPEDAKGLLVSAIEDPNPVLYFEHKHLYRRIKAEVPDERYTVPIGKARTHREGEDISVITWGAMVYTADEAAQQLEADDVSVEIIDLRSVMPWDKKAVLESVRKTSKVLVLHEDTRSGGFGAEIAATIAEEAFEDLDAPLKRVTAPDTPVPFSPPLEKAYIPQVEDVVAGLKELVGVLMATTSVVEVVMPQMGVSVSEGTITKWLKQVGDTVEADESLLEISTDKVDTEVPSPGTGVVQEILVQEGATVDVGTKLATIAPEGAQIAPQAEEPAPPEPATQEAAREAEAASSAETPAPRRAARRLRSAARGRLDRRQDIRLAGRGEDRGRAQRRSGAGARHRPRRPRHEEGHPRLHRVRCAGQRASDAGAAARARAAACARAGASRTRAAADGTRAADRSATRRGPRAHERHAPRHRRAHAPLARHLRARDERDRGRHVEGGRDPREAEEAVPGGLRHQPDVPRLRLARGRRDDPRLPVDQRRDPRRPDRDAQVRQHRLRGRARRRQGPDRPSAEERRGPEPARDRARA